MTQLVSTLAQDHPLATEQYLKFQRVVVFDGKSQAELIDGLKKIIFQIYDSIEIKEITDDEIYIESDIRISNSVVGKLGNPAGKLDFKMAVEVKDNKFRYSLYDFYFTPMERDRYGRYRLQNEDSLAVNEDNYGGQKPLLKKIKKQSKEYAGRLDNMLVKYLSLAYEDNEW